MIDGIAKVIKTGADLYEGLIVGIVVVVAVTFSQIRGRGRPRQAFFPGALGGVAVVTLSLLAGAVALACSSARAPASAAAPGASRCRWQCVKALGNAPRAAQR